MKTRTPPSTCSAVQTGDGEIAREIRAVPSAESIVARSTSSFSIVAILSVAGSGRKCGRSIRRIVRIGVDRIERDFVFLNVRIVQRLVIVQVTGDLDPRFADLFRRGDVAEILLVLFAALPV